MTHAFYLDLCLECAWREQLKTLPNPAVAALVLDKNGAIVSLESHKECGKPHAEILALQSAYASLSGDRTILFLQDSEAIHDYLLKNAIPYFKDTTLYVTLEPCGSGKRGKTPSCAALLRALKPKCVVIGTQDYNKSAKGGAEELLDSGIAVIKAWQEESLQECCKRANALLLPFQALQTKGKFMLFKYASRLDGSINGGQISGDEARSLMHDYRTKADVLLISGESVRVDNPRLDSRFATLAQKNPNVAILTRQEDFPKIAPLFAVPNRSVKILHTLEQVKSLCGFVFCEGGVGFFNTLQDSIDLVLVILSPNFKKDSTLTMSLNASFNLLHSMQIANDIFLWLMPKSKNCVLDSNF
ncbi:bifunctional diaminohydroxyphosphoribosylaminopyrimidine deaminase/5-amino-6-(5-phosphoribosylamino)uracil reductase RibD [Helicobacter sp. Faydin-H64]|uniref:Riboflavin biosynthesis protein RibD n=1 Tax=Helicobacter turcicus TaxID=2867412 RepID=A0ABS7JPW0_9HELI|nr:bifunctional diaminohydroxyphosphoribosylaminopyrimidine deaminase/5-amino-6-(5-phosphoribosylamino)uracil reductase RibD [Helicobacter turcicus]MBX7546272.1 bifunctional diaminohydroxyphosphoribosylaminopyrimidine deaminase/5-amino-6-(5-phosphoribosylamino)uracil reductase RibD [Helicobacter turcicus]